MNAELKSDELNQIYKVLEALLVSGFNGRVVYKMGSLMHNSKPEKWSRLICDELNNAEIEEKVKEILPKKKK